MIWEKKEKKKKKKSESGLGLPSELFIILFI